MDNQICAITEISDKHIHLVRTSVFSFIENNKWFIGKLYLLFHPNFPVSQKSITTITSIYQNIEFVNCSQKNSFKLASDPKNIGKNEEIFIASYKNAIPDLKKDNLFYFSNHCVFLKSILPLLENKQFSFFPKAFFLYTHEAFSNFSESVEDTDIAMYASSFNDAVFIKNKNHLSELSFLIFDTFSNGRASFNKINQVWLHLNHRVNNLLNNPASFKSVLIRDFTEIVDIEKIENIQAGPLDTRISVIIPAYKAHAYIKECLDSIYRQDTKVEFEVLIGIDYCKDTFLALQQIKENYPNLRIFQTTESVGPYIIRNSLVEYSEYPNLLFFDADDIMKENLITKVLSKYRKPSSIRFKYTDFRDGSNYTMNQTLHKTVAHGVFFISKLLFNKIGGFQAWRCGADTEFIKRGKHNSITSHEINESLFYRRIHPKSLTQDVKTNHSSIERNKIKRWIKNNSNWSIPILKTTVNLIEIK